MLTKLMKHEFRATSRIMLPLFLIVLVTSLGAHFSINQIISSGHPILYALGALLLTVLALTICGVCIVSFILMIQRFYRNLLRDEGYVMMTLPVSVHQHIGSKLLVSMIWYAATIAIICLALFILSFRIEFLTIFVKNIDDIIQSIHWETEYIHFIFFFIEILILFVVTCAGQCLQIYASLAISHSFPKHKLLYFFLIFFGIEFASQFLGTILMLFVPFMSILPNISTYTGSHIMFIGMIVFSGLYAMIFYCLTVYFLSNRLNLE